MRHTTLILVERLPGSGKSTLAHALSRQLALHGVPARWWYEEVADHPVYCFRDMPGLRAVVARLAAGDHDGLIADALAKWRRFAALVAAGEEVVIVDGCLFGYLTWSLFPYDVPETTIAAYVAEVGAMLRALRPCVVYLRQQDVAASWRRLCDRRGEGWERSAVARATESAYGRRRGLDGFPGLVEYWREYQGLVDRAFARLAFPKLQLGAGGEACRRI